LFKNGATPGQEKKRVKRGKMQPRVKMSEIFGIAAENGTDAAQIALRFRRQSASGAKGRGRKEKGAGRRKMRKQFQAAADDA